VKVTVGLTGKYISITSISDGWLSIKGSSVGIVPPEGANISEWESALRNRRRSQRRVLSEREPGTVAQCFIPAMMNVRAISHLGDSGGKLRTLDRLPPPGGTEYASIFRIVARLPRYGTPRGTGSAAISSLPPASPPSSCLAGVHGRFTGWRARIGPISLEISVFEIKRVPRYLASAQGTRLKVDLGWLRPGARRCDRQIVAAVGAFVVWPRVGVLKIHGSYRARQFQWRAGLQVLLDIMQDRRSQLAEIPSPRAALYVFQNQRPLVGLQALQQAMDGIIGPEVLLAGWLAWALDGQKAGL
jgi:hypothetical protein